jgi:hypothetical protein
MTVNRSITIHRLLRRKACDLANNEVSTEEYYAKFRREKLRCHIFHYDSIVSAYIRLRKLITNAV